MAQLVDSRDFNLSPQFGGVGAGLQTLAQFQQLGQQNIAMDKQAQIRSILAQQQQAPQTQQQQQLAAQSAGFEDPQSLAEQPQILSLDEKKELAKTVDPAQANKIFESLGIDDPSLRAEASRFGSALENTPFQQRAGVINARIQEIQARGGDAKDTIKLLEMSEQQQNQAALGVQLADLSTKERFAVTGQLAKARATSEKGGLSEVQSAKILEDGTVQFVRKDGTVEIKPPNEVDRDIVARAKGFGVDLQQRRSQARGLGKDAAKASSDAVTSLQSMRSNNATLKQVIDEVRGGAETGPLADKLPSFRAATIRLNQLKNKLGLDVVGAVTFGALSEGELKLALSTALPTTLQGPELIKWAEDKIAAQEKLATYLEDQAIFLGQSGNTRADWITEQRSRAKTQPESPTTPQIVGRFRVKVE